MLPNRYNYLDIGEEYQMKDKLYLERYGIWDTLFPLPSRRRGKDKKKMLSLVNNDLVDE